MPDDIAPVVEALLHADARVVSRPNWHRAAPEDLGALTGHGHRRRAVARRPHGGVVQDGVDELGVHRARRVNAERPGHDVLHAVRERFGRIVEAVPVGDLGRDEQRCPPRRVGAADEVRVIDADGAGADGAHRGHITKATEATLASVERRVVIVVRHGPPFVSGQTAPDRHRLDDLHCLRSRPGMLAGALASREVGRGDVLNVSRGAEAVVDPDQETRPRCPCRRR